MLSSTVLYGVLASFALALAGHAEDGHFPVYLMNTESLLSAGKLFEAELVPTLISHFLGDGQQALSPDSEAILRQFPSRFLDDYDASIVVVDNFDLETSEHALGSPNFFVEDEALETLLNGVKEISVHRLSLSLESGDDMFRLDALESGRNYNQYILDTMRNVKSTKIMLIGLTEPDVYGRFLEASVHHDVRSANGTQHSSYVSIPSSFNSEDECVAQTRACSSRGRCAKTSKGKWSCQCLSTKVDDYTYYWGGNDCSKRDVSFQFNLLVGTTIAIVVAASLSVSLLFKLGAEPLPGVLSTASL